MPDKPPEVPPPEPPPLPESREPREIGREDADSPHAIPIYPPHGDGS